MNTALSIPELLNARDLTLVFAASSIVIVALRTFTHRLDFRLDVFRFMILLTSLPWYAHFWATKTYCAGWGCQDFDVVPRTGLLLFSYVSPAGILVLLLFFIWYARYQPQSAALFPIIAIIVGLLALRLLEWKAPADYIYMNAAADRWLIVSSLAAVVFLGCYAWFRRARPAEEAV